MADRAVVAGTGLCLALLLARAAWSDIRDRRISNRLCLAVALLAIPWWLMVVGGDGMGTVLLRQGMLALAVGLLMLPLFALRIMGGGDVKLFAALMLWLPMGQVLGMVAATLLCGGVLGLLILVLARTGHGRGDSVPYGVAIGLGALHSLGPAVWALATASG